ncbi:flagellar biosynthetic protein FliR [Rhodobacteraceae bacterium MCCB 386]|nr:flagellar biosynthetic protein FliR [Roseitranquillus sediminis]
MAELMATGQETLWVAGIVFLRVGAAMFLLPAFGERLVPARIRLVLALAFTAIVAPAVGPMVAPLATGEAGMVRLIATEAIAGLTIGLMLRLFVMALQIAGTIAAQATSLSQILGDAGIDPQPAIGQLLTIGGLTLAVLADLHVRLAEFIIHSYDILPAGIFPGAALIGEWGIERIAAAFAMAFSLAAPFTIASFVYNLALGVINRAMPQLMVSFVGAPAITLGGLALLLLAAPLMLGLWQQSFLDFIADPAGGR